MCPPTRDRHLGVARRPRPRLVGQALHQPPGAQEVGNDADALGPEEAAALQGLGDPGAGERHEGGLDQPQWRALPRPSRPRPSPSIGAVSPRPSASRRADLGQVGVGVGVGRAAPDHDDGVGGSGLRLSFSDPRLDGAEDERVDAEVAGVGEGDLRVLGPGPCCSAAGPSSFMCPAPRSTSGRAMTWRAPRPARRADGLVDSGAHELEEARLDGRTRAGPAAITAQSSRSSASPSCRARPVPDEEQRPGPHSAAASRRPGGRARSTIAAATAAPPRSPRSVMAARPVRSASTAQRAPWPRRPPRSRRGPRRRGPGAARPPR